MPDANLRRDIVRFLAEDLDRRGDVMSRLVLGQERIESEARIFARERIVVAGLREASAVFERLGCRVLTSLRDGDAVPARTTLLVVAGAAQHILTAERLALNFMGRMSGIATDTRALVQKVRTVNPRCRVAATRKTTPGFRAYEKRAVVLGGGDPHRAGLSDAILIKDNHRDLVGGAGEAVRRARRSRQPVEVEVSTVADAVEAVRAGATWLLIDNLSPRAAKLVAQAARKLKPAVRIEVSGGLNARNVRRYAAFADRLSVGRLTHSARSADVTLEIRTVKP